MASLINNDEGTVYLKGRKLGESKTNQTPDSCKDCTVTCEDLWSIAQMQNIDLEADNGHFIEDEMHNRTGILAVE